MNKQEVYARIVEIGVVPVIRATSARDAMAAVEAVCQGGIPVVEITMTVPGAVELIRDLVRTMGSRVLVGAGTVLDADSARRCIDAGAEFLVSPGFDRAMVEVAISEAKVVMAGALSPTEVLAVWKSGADFVKVFPCGQVGGPDYIKALRGPLPQVPMVPTGGVNLSNAGAFVLAGAAALGVGGELVSADALRKGKSQMIAENARKFVSVIHDARKQLAHAQRSAAASVAS